MFVRSRCFPPLAAVLAFTVLTLAACCSAATAATFDVDTVADDPAKTGCDDATPDDCSLRGALVRANAAGDHDVILVPAGTYIIGTASPCTFETVAGDPVRGDSVIPLCPNSDLEIVGAGSDQTIIQGGGQDRLFAISKLATVTITGVTLQGGKATPGFGYAINGGGAINNQGKLQLRESVLTGNQTTISGGAIFNIGVLTITACTITGNTANQNGGAIATVYSQFQTTGLTIVDSTLGTNGAGNAGAIYNEYTSTSITGSLLAANTGNVAGGIWERGGAVTLVNSTITGGGTGIDVGTNSPAGANTLRLENVTITKNTGYGAGGVAANGELVTLRNTVIANNQATSTFAPDVYGTLTSEGYNLIGNTKNTTIVGDTTGNITGVDARLGDLADNGGPTRSHALLPADDSHAASPAIDAGNPAAPGSGGTACAATDQRGIVRPVGVRCDIGAVEAVSAFEVVRVLPARGGTGGKVLLHVAGNGIDPAATMRLERAGQPAIDGAPVDVDEGRSALTAAVDLASAAEGAWDVVVTNPGDESRRLDAAFVVEPLRTADVWLQVFGPSAMRGGTPTLFTLVYGNRGNVDALDVPITLSLAAGMQYRLAFPIGAPPLGDPDMPIDWQLQPIDLGLDENSGTTNLAFLLPVVPAGSTSTLQFVMTLPPALPHGGSVTSFAAAGTPLLTPEPSEATVSALVASARAYAQQVLLVDVPDTAVPDLAQHAREQLAAVAAEGRVLLVQTGGVGQRVHSLAWIEIELALRATKAVIEADANASLDQRQIFAALVDLLRARVAHAAAPNEAPGGICPIVTCKSGGTLFGGCSCTDITCDGKSASSSGCFPPPIPGPPECEFTAKMTLSGFLEKLKKCKMDKPRCEALPNHHVHTNEDGSQFCVPDGPSDHCPRIEIPNPLGAGSLDCLGTPIKNSHDPNEKTGVAGIGDGHFLLPSTPLAYGIAFENDPLLATAPAQVVTITDQLDPAKVDLSTFALGAMSFGNNLIPMAPGAQQFSGGVDLRPAQNLLVTIDAGVDLDTGLVHWTFTSIDPATMQLTTDADAGFLPPNANPPEGDGQVSFTVAPLGALPAGTSICNSASIVFDVNDPIVTPTWCNTFDETPPASSVVALPATTTGTDIPLTWSGTDTGAGVVAYTIYVSTNGGAFTPFLTDTTDTSATFAGVAGSTYAFYSVAQDGIGNREAVPVSADAQTQLGGDGTRELAITALKGPRSVRLKGATTKAVTVKVQNQGAATLTIPTADALATLVGLEVQPLGTCAAPVAVLKPPRSLLKKPLVLKPKKILTVKLDVTFTCANDPATVKGTPDYGLVAHLDASSAGDAHPEDDVCPRAPTVPGGGVVTRPAGTFKDRGCGAPVDRKTFGGPVVVDVVVPKSR